MPAHSKEVIDKFCKLCDRLKQTWQMRKFLFDENPHIADLKKPRHEHFFYRLQEVLQESWLQQLAKLHDPAVQWGSINLSIEYIIEYGNWVTKTKNKLVKLKLEMDKVLPKAIKDARNKIVSHNDLKVLLESTALGTFGPGEDEEYFARLNKFANLVRQAALGEPFLSNESFVKSDVLDFMKTFRSGLSARFERRKKFA